MKIQTKLDPSNAVSLQKLYNSLSIENLEFILYIYQFFPQQIIQNTPVQLIRWILHVKQKHSLIRRPHSGGAEKNKKKNYTWDNQKAILEFHKAINQSIQINKDGFFITLDGKIIKQSSDQSYFIDNPPSDMKKINTLNYKSIISLMDQVNRNIFRIDEQKKVFLNIPEYNIQLYQKDSMLINRSFILLILTYVFPSSKEIGSQMWKDKSLNQLQLLIWNIFKEIGNDLS